MEVTTADFVRAKRIAAWYHRTKAPMVELDDLVGSAMIGLCHAARDFDATMGFSFWTYAGDRVIGAMRDELRKMDWLTRRERANVVRAEVGAEPEWREQPSPWAAIPLPATSLNAPVGGKAEPGITEFSDTHGHNDPAFEEFDLHDALAAAWDLLDDRERFVITMHDIEGYEQEKLAQIMGVTGGRVSQIRKRGHGKMRRILGRDFNLP